jgi:hypothetical protein
MRQKCTVGTKSAEKSCSGARNYPGTGQLIPEGSKLTGTEKADEVVENELELAPRADYNHLFEK